MTKINCYCEKCQTWQEVKVIDVSVESVILHLDCGHRVQIYGLFSMGTGVTFL